MTIVSLARWNYLDNSGSAKDGMDRIPQIVRDDGEHIVPNARGAFSDRQRRFQLHIEPAKLRVAAGGLSVRGLLGGKLTRLLFGLSTRSEIAGDFRKSDQLSVAVPDCRYDDVGPEARAVLANAPALVLKVADSRGLFQLPFRKSIGDGFLRIEYLE